MKALLLSMLLLAPLFASAETPPTNTSSSIYNLQAALTNQAGAAHALDVYRGHPVLITMFYGSCPMTCPLLIDTLRTIERDLPPAQRSQLRVLMISIDPEHDTTAALKALAQERHIDQTRWTLAHTDARAVRKIAAALNVQYRPLPNGGFNHSSVITLLDAGGEIVMQSSVIGKIDPALMQAVADQMRSGARRK